MRKGFLSVLVGLWLAFPAFAQSPLALAPDEREAIRSTIERQIEAFRADDGAAAFAFADANIQSMFGSPERFMAMVRQGYAMIYRPRSYAFGDAKPDGGIVAQIVEFDGLDGTSAVALYYMARQKDGSFRIAGVELLPAKRPGV
ncbi:MAG: DUF4864 domain-containing protein [Magnetospirillum sp.]|nr:DUF4864 domain-containing protein [Magnetospirillum sp.]